MADHSSGISSGQKLLVESRKILITLRDLLTVFFPMNKCKFMSTIESECTCRYVQEEHG